MLKYTLHNHTYLCKHASGSATDMVLRAKEDGYELIGISDHVAYPISATQYRMEFEERIAYLEELAQLKAKYKILRGFEAEYQSQFLEYLKDLFRDNQIDYLVLGQHFADVNDVASYFGTASTDASIINYVDMCIEGMKSGLFLFLAHPDLFLANNENFDEFIVLQSTRLIKAAMLYNIPLEYNGGGVRSQFNRDGGYPVREFWQLVQKLGADVIVNSDAHSPDEISDKAYHLAIKQAQDLNLKIIEDINLEEYFKRVKNNI